MTPTQAEEFTGVIVIADGKGFTVTEKVAVYLLQYIIDKDQKSVN